MSSAAVGTHHHSGAGPLSLMSCVRESSPLQDYEPPDNEKNAATKRKFWNPKKWFKRKNKATEDVIPVEIHDKDDLRSRSTSELSITDEPIVRRSGPSMHPGLSVSHDSVFHSPNSGSDIELDAAQSSSSLSISQPQIDSRLQTELSERLRLRRGRGDTSEDDEGLPHSPCNSPTTTDTLLDKTAIKDLPTKSHSTCSDGSLLSMGSSEMDEEFFGQQSRHSSKLSLQDQESDFELGPSSSAAPLNHSAAHHRVSVRPKRRAPHRNKRVPQLSSALPTTPEVNEESSIRSVTPENASRETFTEQYSMSTRTTLTETQLKCSSLPPGLVPPGGGGGDATRLNRSRSNAGSKSQDQFSALEEDVEKEEKSDKSFFDRIFPRRSAKKRKSKEDKPPLPTQTTQTYSKVESSSYSKRVESKPIAAPRSGAASRQRIQPIDLPPSPDSQRREPPEYILPKPSPEKSFAGTSPLHAELESRFKQRQTLNNASLTPPQSPKFTRNVDSSVISKLEVVSKQAEFRRESKEEVRRESKEEMRRESKEEIRRASKEEVRREVRRESRNEEIKSKVKIPGLSSLQQKAWSLNSDRQSLDDEVDDSGYKSLTDFSDDNVKPVIIKSHSFKTVKPAGLEKDDDRGIVNEATNEKIFVGKSSSLDSVKHFQEPNVLEKKFEESVQSHSEMKQEVSLVKEELKEELAKEAILPLNFDLAAEIFNDINNITISGPSHTAVVNVSSNTTDTFSSSNTKTETLSTSDKVKEVTTKESVSVTKIQLKRESTQITQSTVTVPKSAIPEFFNRQLNKVEVKPASNVVLSMNSPRIIDDQNRPKSLFTSVEQDQVKNAPRKFSQEDIEIVEKGEEETQKDSSSIVVSPVVVQPQARFKKNDVNKRKSSTSSVTPDSPSSEKPFFRSRSVSLDSLKGEDTSDKSSQDSLDKLEEKEEYGVKEKSSGSIVETVVLRKKSMLKQKNDEEPELMKVFARRSLKLKDAESDSVNQQVTSMIEANDAKTRDSDKEKTRDSDKENQADSPQEERKRSVGKVKEPLNESKLPQEERKRSVGKPKEPLNESKLFKKEEENREPLTETATKEQPNLTERKYIEVAEVTLRRPSNNNNLYSRAFSLNPQKSEKEETKVTKQASFSERRITDNWISNIKNGEDLIERKISQEEIITAISPKSDYITEELLTERKNFNQRKAEWEKRAQEAQKKSVP